MAQIVQSKFIDLTDLNLECDCAYNIVIDENHSATFTKSVDNSKQNFFLYSSPRSRMYLIIIKPDTVLTTALQFSIDSYQKETGLIIHGVL